MRVKERTVWRVRCGSVDRWFPGEIGARDFAGDRFNDVDGPIPFVEQVNLSEVLTRLNELELGRKSFMDSYGTDLSEASK